VAVPETPPPSRSHRVWVLDAALLLLLAICGFIVWYSKLPMDSRFLGLREWVKVHMLH
jgi:ABC-type transporter Mla subunit MlaD